MKVVVTGGAGFIGGNFVHYHLKEHPEDRVICIDLMLTDLLRILRSSLRLILLVLQP